MAGRMPAETTVLAWARLMKAQRLALTLVQDASKAAGLPPLEWYDVLLEVERAGSPGIRPRELERGLLFAQYNLSRLLDRMEAAGLIARAPCETDGRGQVILLTDAGRAQRKRMWPVYAAAIEQAVGAHLTTREAETLGATLATLIAGLSAVAVKPRDPDA